MAINDALKAAMAARRKETRPPHPDRGSEFSTMGATPERRDFQQRFERLGRVHSGTPSPNRLTPADCARENAECDARGERVVARPSVARLRALQRRLQARTPPLPR